MFDGRTSESAVRVKPAYMPFASRLTGLLDRNRGGGFGGDGGDVDDDEVGGGDLSSSLNDLSPPLSS